MLVLLCLRCFFFLFHPSSCNPLFFLSTSSSVPFSLSLRDDAKMAHEVDVSLNKNLDIK